uniref:Inositol hexakisphosphate and diphosphoinositol-pentakisphosphate kinase n=1 Tax=Amphimedon queenslandica TaxID=400682 RepID=A0A1X7UU03_AMPQE
MAESLSDSLSRRGLPSLKESDVSPSPSPLSSTKLFLDVELEQLADFNGVTLGVCAMNKKSFSGPMNSILTRIGSHEHVRVIIFTDNTILYKPVEEWPYCDALIAFYSKGFPLDKALRYVKLKSPKMLVNDLEMQYALMDRRKVYDILVKNGIEVPPHVICNRDGSDKGLKISEVDEDTLEVNGVTFHKPFVEKPISAEDHNIYIYFPSDYGGGCQRLFRKVKDRSSTYSNESNVRKDGSYIYEDFMATDGTDVKVYTVGPDYAHSEARKSPALDGRVDRDDRGKEKRFPVLLTTKEKVIARKVCIAFKQTVCGFDLLRSNGNSYVCDVNGFSFVKNSDKYYDDCSQIILESILSKVAPHYIPENEPSIAHLAPTVPVPIFSRGRCELRCVIGVIRHADRTPKQKMKMIVRHHYFFSLFEELGGYKKQQIKIKKPKELQKVLDIVRKLINEGEDDEIFFNKLQQLKTVLEMYDHFSGINRKVQFKLIHKDINNTPLESPALLLIAKWGGEVTPAGERVAEELGKAFRCMYPGGEGEYSLLPGSGFLRLHSTYRHDLKVYASDEGRVQLSAAAFTKGLLDLEGNMASILAHLVKMDQNTTDMLDTSSDAAESLNRVKQDLHQMLQSTRDFDAEAIKNLAPTLSPPLLAAIKEVKNPHKTCRTIQENLRTLVMSFEDIARKKSDLQLYHGESIKLAISRWKKLEKDFVLSNGKFDISKIPDIYDCIKYDLQHNRILELSDGVSLYKAVSNLADIVIPLEYGITIEDKISISKIVCRHLLKKIRADLSHTYNIGSDFIHRLDPKKSKGVISPDRCVRTRLYFTSESHIHSLVNILKYGGIPIPEENYGKLHDPPELNYLSQVVFMVFENKTEPIDSYRYRVEVHFSPGVKSRKRLLKGEPISENVSLTKLKKMPLVDTPSTGGGGNNSQPLRRRSAQSSSAAAGESPDDDTLGLRKERLRKFVQDGPDGHRRSSLEGYKYSPPNSDSLVSVLEPLSYITSMDLHQMEKGLAKLCVDF